MWTGIPLPQVRSSDPRELCVCFTFPFLTSGEKKLNWTLQITAHCQLWQVRPSSLVLFYLEQLSYSPNFDSPCFPPETSMLMFLTMFSQFSPVAQSCPTRQPRGLQHARLPCPSPTPRAWSSSCPSSRWCHPAISSSVVPFFSCFQSFPASGSFPLTHLFASGARYWSYSFSISPSHEYSGLISLRID